jgi:type IV pilus assembly protein PilO
MADLSRARKRILYTIVALGVIDAAALIYLALPLRAGVAQPEQVQQQAQEEYRRLSRTNVPLRGIDQKLVQAQKDDAAFIERRLPSRYSDVVEELGKLANANHVAIGSIGYTPSAGDLSGVLNLEMHAGLAGQYVNIVKFMNAIERDKMFFIIDSIGLTGQGASKNGPTGVVHLDMKLDTYLRTQS